MRFFRLQPSTGLPKTNHRASFSPYGYNHRLLAICLEFWCEYAATLVSNMTPEAAQSLKESIVNDLKKVASATGGVLGWGAVSDGESAILRRVEAALTRKN